MAQRDERFESANDFEPEAITSHGTGNKRVRELSDPDALVMLGKLAAAVARLETTIGEFAREWKEDRREWKEDRKQLRKHQRRGAFNVAGAIVAVEAIVEGLRHAWIVK